MSLAVTTLIQEKFRLVKIFFLAGQPVKLY